MEVQERNSMTFYEVPVGATFRWGNVSIFKKTRAVRQDDIYQDAMAPNCIDLGNGHQCTMSAIFMCYDVEE